MPVMAQLEHDVHTFADQRCVWEWSTRSHAWLGPQDLIGARAVVELGGTLRRVFSGARALSRLPTPSTLAVRGRAS
jgi:hypothetical protein